MKIKKAFKKNLLYGILLFFGFLFLIYVISPDLFNSLSPQTSICRELYKQGRKAQENGNYALAYTNYEKIMPIYSAYSIVLFQQAKCAAQLGKEKVVIDKLGTLLFRFANSAVAAQSSYNLGQAYMRTSQFDKAQEQFTNTINNYKNTKYASASCYYLGQLYSNKNKNLALEYWIKYLNLSPDGRFASDCINGIKELKTGLSQNDAKTLAVALYKEQKYYEAINYLSQIPKKQSWYYLAKCYQNIGDYNTALSLYKTGIYGYNSSIEPANLQNAMLSYVSLAHQSKLTSWSELVANIKISRDFALFHKAQLVSKNDALNLYQEVAFNYPHSFYASDALWKLFWNKFSKNSYTDAIELGKRHIKFYTNTKASPKILFWIAKAYEREGKNTIASGYYNKLLTQYPDSYYAFRANQRLKALNFGKDRQWTSNSAKLKNNSNFSYLPYSFDEISKKYGSDIAELVHVGDYETLLNIIDNDPYLESWVKLEDGYPTRSIVIARDAMIKEMPKPDVDDNRWKLIYPLFFVDEINNYSFSNDIEPVLTISLIREESHFNPLAISGSNARGLMQLLPGTAADISRWSRYGQINELELFNPKINIKLGTAYLKHSKNDLHNSNLFAVAGYNGGPGAVKRWLRTIPHQDLDQFIENIPYDQTRDYIKKVFASYWNYKRIYHLG